jgi:SOS response regulatory protein OraA/RecX
VRRAGERPAVEDPDDADAAESAALLILTAAGKSSAALQRRLRQRGFSWTATREAVRRCSERGYVDDAELAISLTGRAQRAGRGRARIAAELRARGIPRELVDQSLSTIAAEDEDSAALVVARRLLEKEMRNHPDSDGIRRRIVASMQRRGYASSVIARALRTLSDESRR